MQVPAFALKPYSLVSRAEAIDCRVRPGVGSTGQKICPEHSPLQQQLALYDKIRDL